MIWGCVALCVVGVARPQGTGGRGPEPAGLLGAPAGDQPTRIDLTGETVLPNGRLITPRGVQVKVAPHPYGLTLSPDGQTLVTSNTGTAPFSVSILTDLETPRPKVAQIPEGFPRRDTESDPDSVFQGVAIAPDNQTLYISEGNNGQVGIFDLLRHKDLGILSADCEFEGKKYADSLTGELKLSPDGRWLYVVDMAHLRLVIFDTHSRRIAGSVNVGRMPFGLALSPDGRRAYVSNVGTFRYSLVPGYDPKRVKDTGLDFPPYGYPSKQEEEGVEVDGRKIPGLGDPNVLESNSVWVIDLTDPARPQVVARVKTGTPIGQQSVGGSSPGGLVAGRRKIYVSNATQDSISIIDAKSNRMEKTLVLEPARSMQGLRGVLPFGMALSPDQTRLYVACSGINALAVLDARKGKVLGYIPTGWFPARVETSHDGKMVYLTNGKGFGAGPNGGANFHKGPEGTYIGDITKGTVSIIPVSPSRAFRGETFQSLRNNGFLPSSVNSLPDYLAYLKKPSSAQLATAAQQTATVGMTKIHHVVYIVKEHRTFDQVFGDFTASNSEKVEADPSLTEYGSNVTVKGRAKEGTLSVEHADVTPNHHALARRFAISDNFYVDGDVSVDGHHWLVNNYPNEMFEASWPSAYGGKFDFKPDDDAPGRVEIGACNPWPETYLEAGSLWEHLSRSKISFRNYGEGFEMGGDDESAALEPTGVRLSTNLPMPEVLFENTSHSYPTFNLNISDQYRFQQFKSEFDVRFADTQNTPLPQLLFIWLPNDHTADPRPQEGYPYRASYVADNDLALGKLVELFSHGPYWKDTAIFVTEDDAQGGTDHVDAHRSVLMIISPYAHGVCHTHVSTSSILKTIDLIFGMSYLNQYDAAASDLGACFTSQPDFTPYTVLQEDSRVFDPTKVVESGLEINASSPRLDDPADIRKELREEGAH
jgi:DNA-binding beta-propeller fold protein YncE